MLAPASKDALSYVPLPSRTRHPLEHLNGQNLLSGFGLAGSGGYALAALPKRYIQPFKQKIGTFFA